MPSGISYQSIFQAKRRGSRGLRLIDLLLGEFTQVNLTVELSETEITGLTADSRAVEPGFLFAALPGSTVDGRSFIDAAISKGAAAVLAPEGTDIANDNVALIASRDARASLAHIAAKFYIDQPATIAAITGTNGKTSVAHFTRQIWSMLGHRAASIGTLGLQMPDGSVKPSLTTPDPVTLHVDLAKLARSGVDHAVMEASSHGLEQRRLDGVRLSVAAFTNLSRDHMDYHRTIEAYRQAKARLFSDLLPANGIAVLNADTPEIADLASAFEGRVISYGQHGNELKLQMVEPLHNGTRIVLNALGHQTRIDLPLAGAFQVYNVLCAAGIALACGETSERVIGCLQNLEGTPGRLELAGSTMGGSVYIDYAHTPDALENVLTDMRPHTNGRLIVVFGCGGDRDRGKRPMMGRVASKLADIAVATDDNPRLEDADTIRSEILAGAPDVRNISDRETAIREAVSMLSEGDILVIAGKGHETGQIVGSETLPFNDLVVARTAIAESKGIVS